MSPCLHSALPIQPPFVSYSSWDNDSQSYGPTSPAGAPPSSSHPVSPRPPLPALGLRPHWLPYLCSQGLSPSAGFAHAVPCAGMPFLLLSAQELYFSSQVLPGLCLGITLSLTFSLLTVVGLESA